MRDSIVQHPGGGTFGRNVVQNEKHVSNRAAGEGAVRAGGELRRGKGMGRFADENLSDERESTEKIPSVGVY